MVINKDSTLPISVIGGRRDLKTERLRERWCVEYSKDINFQTSRIAKKVTDRLCFLKPVITLFFLRKKNVLCIFYFILFPFAFL